VPRRIAKIIGLGAGALALAAGLAFVGWAWNESRIPGTYDAMAYGRLDYGGGPRVHSMGPMPSMPSMAGHRMSVAALHGPPGEPDVRFRLVARKADVRLASGRVVHGLTFNGRSPGPELRVRQGDLVEIVLENADVDGGVTIHWHGVDVPNAEDGVAGVTQDAVPPGKRYTYRFRPSQAGTYWYHSHQSSAEEVGRGLFGAFVVEPRRPLPRGTLDLALVAHEFDGILALGSSDRLERRAVAAGTPVRLRLVNSVGRPMTFTLDGTPCRVLAIDGTDLDGPTPLRDTALELAGGGRYDVGFTMPATPVALRLRGSDASLVLGSGTPPETTPRRTFDPASYGRPAHTPFGASSRFDRRFTMRIGKKFGFMDGRLGFHWSLNGGVYPDVPMFVVQSGDLVKVEIVNGTSSVHPMHLHGHHALVLSRNGKPTTGSPWWTDTLDVAGGERYELAFRAKNPGLWMDHCHNLRHAAAGLTMHVMYEGLETPFVLGGAAHNRPE
jgi:FtsP/CotA-like multicopper oxidase with cupredoxin domain